jgi:hypothetical protein
LSLIVKRTVLGIHYDLALCFNVPPFVSRKGAKIFKGAAARGEADFQLSGIKHIARNGARRCLPNSSLLKIFAPLRETIGTCFWNTRICEIIKCTVIVIHAFLSKFTVEFIIPAKSVQDRRLQRLHAFGVFCRGFVR